MSLIGRDVDAVPTIERQTPRVVVAGCAFGATDG
jgi:hypothetical protein